MSMKQDMPTPENRLTSFFVTVAVAGAAAVVAYDEGLKKNGEQTQDLRNRLISLQEKQEHTALENAMARGRDAARNADFSARHGLTDLRLGEGASQTDYQACASETAGFVIKTDLALPFSATAADGRKMEGALCIAAARNMPVIVRLRPALEKIW